MQPAFTEPRAYLPPPPPTYFFGRGVRPGPRHPNPGLNQKFGIVYPDVNQISVSIHYIYVAPNYIWIIFSAYNQSIIFSKDPINNK